MNKYVLIAAALIAGCSSRGGAPAHVLSEQQALAFAAREICPADPGSILPQLTTALDDDKWNVWVGPHDNMITFTVLTTPFTEEVFLLARSKEAEAYKSQKSAICTDENSESPTNTPMQ